MLQIPSLARVWSDRATDRTDFPSHHFVLFYWLVFYIIVILMFLSFCIFVLFFTPAVWLRGRSWRQPTHFSTYVYVCNALPLLKMDFRNQKPGLCRQPLYPGTNKIWYTTDAGQNLWVLHMGQPKLQHKQMRIPHAGIQSPKDVCRFLQPQDQRQPHPQPKIGGSVPVPGSRDRYKP